jgi:hypothetical protein
LCAFFYGKHADAPIRRISRGIGLGRNSLDIAVPAIGNEHFAAIAQIIIALFLGR